MEDNDLGSAGDPEVQDPPSTEEGGSTTSAETSQELETLRAELAAAQQAIEDSKSQIGTLQSTKDREVRAAEARYQRLVNQLSQDRSKEERATLIERAKRAKEDPDEAEALANELLSRLQRSEADEEWQVKIARAQYETAQQEYTRIYYDPDLSLSQEERKEAERRAVEESQKKNEPFTAAAFVRHATAIQAEKARSPMSDFEERLKSLEDENKALKSAAAGNALKSAGGPEPPLAGGASGKPFRSLEEAEAAHVRGEINNAQMRELRRTLQYAGYR